jgi:hypothetical protein
MGGESPTLGEGAEGGTERAKRSGGLHKRSAEDWGNPLQARGAKLPLEVGEGGVAGGKPAGVGGGRQRPLLAADREGRSPSHEIKETELVQRL